MAESDFFITFIPLTNGFKPKRIINVKSSVTIGRTTETDSDVLAGTLKFNSKVVSRLHATLTNKEGRIWLQDTKSSGGTFLNGIRLSPQGQESTPIEIHDGDIVKLGEDCEVNGALYPCVVMKSVFHGNRIETGSNDSGIQNNTDMDADYVDYATDPEVRAVIDSEFQTIWNSLTKGLENPLKRLRSLTDQVRSQRKASSVGSPNAETPVIAVVPPSTTTPTAPASTAKVAPAVVTARQAGVEPAPQSPKSQTFVYKRKTSITSLNSTAADETTIKECLAYIDKLKLPLVQDEQTRASLRALVEQGDPQILTYYKSLAQYPASFANVAVKHVLKKNEP